MTSGNAANRHFSFRCSPNPDDDLEWTPDAVNGSQRTRSLAR